MDYSTQYSPAPLTDFGMNGMNSGMIEKTTDGGNTWANSTGWAAINHGSYGLSQILSDPYSNALFAVEEYSPDSGATYYSRVWFSANAGQSFTELTIASHDSTSNASNCFLAGEFSREATFILPRISGYSTAPTRRNLVADECHRTAKQ